MAIKERKSDPELTAANVAIVKRLIAKLEEALRNGTLRPVNPNAKPITMKIRGKGG